MNEHTVAMFDRVQPEKDLYRKLKKQTSCSEQNSLRKRSVNSCRRQKIESNHRVDLHVQKNEKSFDRR